MKKIVLALAIPMLCTSLVSNSQIRVGVALGAAVAKMEGSISGDGRAGLLSSMVIDAHLNKNFSFFPTLSYVQKGVTEPTTTPIDKQYVALRYMELSPNFIYHIGNAQGSSFFLGAGPSIAFNLPSKRVSISEGDKVTTDIIFGEIAASDVKGVDYGVNVVLGWRTGPGFFILGNYNKGLRDLSPAGRTMETKNKYFGIQLGWYLNNGKKEN